MPNTTTNYGLKKPLPSEFYDINVHNENMEIIDEKLKELESRPTTPAEHDHDDRYYTETEVDNLLKNKSDSGHTHDGRYYTETEVNNLLKNKSDAGHAHNDLYHTKSEINAMLKEQAPSYTYGTTDLTAGTSPLENGKLYFVYE